MRSPSFGGPARNPDGAGLDEKDQVARIAREIDACAALQLEHARQPGELPALRVREGTDQAEPFEIPELRVCRHMSRRGVLPTVRDGRIVKITTGRDAWRVGQA